ncbi:MAG: hypothetical protein WAV50_00085 [Minisyncoccia bacterium]
MNKVTIAEALHLRVVKWLKENGYSISYSDHNTVAFKSAKEEGWLKWLDRLAGDYLTATLFITRTSDGTPKNDGWLIQVYGRDNMDQFVRMAEQLKEAFQTHIHVRLEEENEIRSS